MDPSKLFERSRRKIIASIMAVLVALFAATLAAIFAFSYNEVYERNIRMLQEYAASYQANSLPMAFMKTEDGMLYGSGDYVKRAPFYAVLYDPYGYVAAVENILSSGYSNDQLIESADHALQSSSRTGTEGPFLYAVEKTPRYTLVVFMDDTLVSQSMGTLFRYALIVGLIAMVALFFLARWLARKIVEPMREAYEAQRSFISDAGHELKTPVSVVEANAELLQREIGDDRWLSNIRHENRRMGVLVSRLLELSHTTGHEVPKTEVDLSRIVEAEALSHEPMAFENGMKIDVLVDEGVVVEGDASELERVVSILLDNAVSHGAPGKDIGMALTRVKKTARLIVTNAVEEADVERLSQIDPFERFTRASESRTGEDERGSAHYGLGLAIAKAILLSHGGSIDAKVDKDARTIAFTATIPAVP